MLSAILHGKGRRIPDDVIPGASLKSVFKHSEDLLTATVFERLSYLDGETIWQILSETFKPRVLRDWKIATLEEIEFWPFWNKAKSILQKGVEPDVVLRFSVGDPSRSVTIIIECKVDGAQSANQWAEQWIAHREEYPGDEGPNECYLLALGGLKDGPLETVASFTEQIAGEHGDLRGILAAAARWMDLLNALLNVEDKTPGVRRITSDIREALALYDIQRFHAFSDFSSYSVRLRGEFEKSVQRLDTKSLRHPSDDDNRQVNARGISPEPHAAGRIMANDWSLQLESFPPIKTKPNFFRNLEPLK